MNYILHYILCNFLTGRTVCKKVRRRIDQISRITGGTPPVDRTHIVSEETTDSSRHMSNITASESEITSSELSQGGAVSVCLTQRHLSEPIESLRVSTITTESSTSHGAGSLTSASLSGSSVDYTRPSGGNIVKQRGTDRVSVVSAPGNIILVKSGQLPLQGIKSTTSEPGAKVMYLVPAKLVRQRSEEKRVDIARGSEGGFVPPDPNESQKSVLNPAVITATQPHASQRNVQIFSTAVPMGTTHSTRERPYMGDPDVIIQGEELPDSREGVPMGSPLNLSCKGSDSGSDISQALSVPLTSNNNRNNRELAGNLHRASHSDSEAASLVFTGNVPTIEQMQIASSTAPGTDQQSVDNVEKSDKEVWYPQGHPRGYPMYFREHSTTKLELPKTHVINSQTEAGNSQSGNKAITDLGNPQDDPDCYITSESQSVDPTADSIDLSTHSVEPSSTGQISGGQGPSLHSVLQERLVRNLPGNEPKRRQIIAIPVQMKEDKIVVFCEDKLRMEWAYDSSLLSSS